MPTDQKPARDAATIIIVREADEGPQIFMVRRHSKSAFMANRYVYPGGKLDRLDCTPMAARRVEGLTPDQALERLDEDIAPLDALGLFLAGIRETFEEAGILLARRADEDVLIDLTSDAYVSRTFERYRRQLIDGDIALSELAEAENLVFPLDRLGYFAHWITPLAESHRYDTRFFVALAPQSQRPLHDAEETTDSTWISPREAIERNQNGELQLAPPTLCTLRRLMQFDSAANAFAWSLQHHPPTILPHMEQRDGRTWIFLPGDPEFPANRDAYADVEPIDGDVTRLVAEEVGLWRIRDASV